jgi:hypothetical protein
MKIFTLAIVCENCVMVDPFPSCFSHVAVGNICMDVYGDCSWADCRLSLCDYKYW